MHLNAEWAGEAAAWLDRHGHPVRPLLDKLHADRSDLVYGRQIPAALFATVLPAKASTGAVLGLLLVGDLIAVRMYHAHADWTILRRLIPSVVAGVLLGVVVLWSADDAAVQALRTTLFRLRKLIGEEVILRQDGRLTLDPTCCWVDCWAERPLRSTTARPASATWWCGRGPSSSSGSSNRLW